jgi:hypothetical protein
VAKDRTKEKTFMDRWVEPTLAPPKPSFEDHGAAPYGVLEHMQPLGEAPNTKAKQRGRAVDGPRKSVMGRSSAAVGSDAQTPEGSPAPAAPPSPPPPPPPPADLPFPPPHATVDDENDDDYAPGVNGKKRKKERTSTRGRPSKHKPGSASSVTPAPPPPVETKGEESPSWPMAADTKREGSPSWPVDAPPPDHVFQYEGEKLERIVQSAKERAYECGKPDLAAAVHEIYLQSFHDFKLRILLEGILRQTAAPEQHVEFQGYVKAVKKKLRAARHKARRAKAAWMRDADAAASETIKREAPTEHKLTLHPSASSASAAPPSSSAAAAAALPSTEPRERPKPRISLKVKEPAKDPTRRRSGNRNMSISPRKRGGSVGSDSSLTSLTSNGGSDEEDDLMNGNEPEPRDMRAPVPPPVTNGNRGKDHAAERGSLAVPGGGHMKRTSAEAEIEDERDRAFAAKKQKLSEGIARDYDFEESSVRPGLSAHKTRVQRVKDGALAPPKLRLDPSNSRTTSTRGSRAASTDLDSPLSDLSPPGSRQSTPRMNKTSLKPPAKRAKTKQS